MKQSVVALPKTYHQPASRGTRCIMEGPTSSEIPSRSSNQRQSFKERPFITRLLFELGWGQLRFGPDRPAGARCSEAADVGEGRPLPSHLYKRRRHGTDT